MIWLIAYDINVENRFGRKRAKKVRSLCLQYGDRLQKSVYFFRVRSATINKLYNNLNKIIDSNTDHVVLLQLKYNKNNFDSLKTLIDLDKFVV